MRILITGGTGQLGRDLSRVLTSHDVTALGHAQLDVTDPEAVDAAFAKARPDVVVHCAALTDTARCEREHEMALRVNAGGAESVARAAADCGAVLIAISTNEVFDGERRASYLEDDAPNPINAYGASKLEGERRVRDVHPEARIVRTSWLYGDGDANFPAKVLAAARHGRPLRFVTDEVASPTSTRDLAEAISELAGRTAPAGIYHLTNMGEASRYEWAREVLRLAGMQDVVIQPVTIEELRMSGYDGPRKPPYSVLTNTRGRAAGIVLRPWKEGLASHFERAQVTADG